MGKVLLIGFPPKDLKRVVDFFRTVDVVCDAASNIESAIDKIAKDAPTVVVADRPARLDEVHGLNEALRQSSPTTPFLVVLPDSRIETALPVLRAGAFDCVARPYDRNRLLSAAKRAAFRNGRTLFVPKIRPRRRRAGLVGAMALGFLVALSVLSLGVRRVPAPTLDLGSATISGVQWSGHRLWVGNWYDSTVTLYELGRSVFGKSTKLLPREVVRLPDVQPILLCETPVSFITVGFDLMFRRHSPAPGLPIEQTVKAPGTSPTGLAWDGKFLWSCDSNTGLLYRHGADLAVIETIPSIILQPMGLAEEGGLWVIGGTPLRVARLERSGKGYVWHGPYLASTLLGQGVPATGFAAGYHRLWAVSGGDPTLTSISLSRLRGTPELWKKIQGAP